MRLKFGLRAEKRSVGAKWYAQVQGGYNAWQDRVARDETPTGSYATLDASAGVTVHPAGQESEMTLRVVGHNLTNARYRDHLSMVEGMGRTIRVGVDITF